MRSVRSGKSCCVCRRQWELAQQKTNKIVRFHKFPYRNAKALRKWIKAVRKAVPKFIPKGDVRICSLHFQSNDYKGKSGSYDDKFLKHGVVPSRYLGSFDWRPNCNQKCHSTINDHFDEQDMVEEQAEQVPSSCTELRVSLSTTANFEVRPSREDSEVLLFKSIGIPKAKISILENEESNYSCSDSQSDTQESLEDESSTLYHNESNNLPQSEETAIDRHSVDEQKTNSRDSLLNILEENSISLEPQNEKIPDNRNSIEEHELESRDSLLNISEENSIPLVPQNEKIFDDRNALEEHDKSGSRESLLNILEKNCNSLEPQNEKIPDNRNSVEEHESESQESLSNTSEDNCILLESQNEEIPDDGNSVEEHESDSRESLEKNSNLLDPQSEKISDDGNVEDHSQSESQKSPTNTEGETFQENACSGEPKNDAVVKNQRVNLEPANEWRSRVPKKRIVDELNGIYTFIRPENKFASCNSGSPKHNEQSTFTKNSTIEVETPVIVYSSERMDIDNSISSVSIPAQSLNHPGTNESTNQPETFTAAPSGMNVDRDDSSDEGDNAHPHSSSGNDDVTSEPVLLLNEPDEEFSPDRKHVNAMDTEENSDFSNIGSNKNNIDQSQETYTCELCKKILPTLKRYKRHKKWHMKSRYYPCKICKKVLSAQLSWNYHMNKHNDYKPFECMSCDRSFFSKAARNDHEKRCHCVPDIQKENQTTNIELLVKQEEIPNILCKFCDEVFTKYEHYKAHKKWHLENRSYSCKICGKILAHQLSWEYHMGTHEKERPFKCESCGKSFISQTLLNKHMKRHVYGCNICAKTFTARFKLKKHRQKHKVKKYACEICGKRFRKQNNLQIHTAKHTPKMYRCQYCDFVYPSKRELDQHIERTGENLTICVYCLETFEDYLDFKRHIIEMHEKQESFVCTECDKAFTSMKLLEDHVQMHVDQPVAS